MKLTVFLVTIFLTGLAKGECFREHLREAIALNSSRADLYALLTAEASRPVSRMLIDSEEMMLRGSYLIDIDAMAVPYEKAGIKVTCDAYVSMKRVPPFRPQFSNGPVPLEKDYDIRSLRVGARLSRAFFGRDESKLLKEARSILDEMKTEPRLYCMTRHLVESIARVAALIPLHEAKAKAFGLRSPRALHRLMIRGHLSLIERSRRIDEKAKPFNQAGIPLVCQDVPPISLPSRPL